MRKTFFALSALLGLTMSVFVIQSCKKESPSAPHSATSASQAPPDMRNLAREMQLDVHDLGFLSFSTAAASDDFLVWLTQGTHAEAKTFLADKGFASKALSMYGDELNDQLVSAEQAPNYMLTSASTVQVQGVVMKISSDQRHVTTLTGSNITSENYAELATGNFAADIMNRFGTGDRNNALAGGFFGYNISNPAGFDEPLPDEPPVSGKFWGWGRWQLADTNPAYCSNCHRVCRTYYVLWIPVDDECENRPN